MSRYIVPAGIQVIIDPKTPATFEEYEEAGKIAIAYLESKGIECWGDFKQIGIKIVKSELKNGELK